MERCSCSECKRVQDHVRSLTASFRARPVQQVAYRIEEPVDYRNYLAAQAYMAVTEPGYLESEALVS